MQNIKRLKIKTSKYKFLKFILTGCFNTIVFFIIFFLFYKLGLNYKLASFISYLIAATISYFINKNIVFISKENRFFYFVIINLSMSYLNIILLQFFLIALNYQLFFAQFIVLSIITTISFILYRHIFK